MSDRDQKGQEVQRRRGRLAYLGGLAGALVHEIKNPLSTITVNLSLIREDLVEPLEPTERRTLRRIEAVEKQVHRLEDILNDFLQFARGFQLSPKSVDIEKLLTDLVEFVEPEAAGRRVRIRIQFEPSIPRLMIDERYLQQAVLNLLINAQHAMEPDGGDIVIRVTRSQDLGKPTVNISVIDTGPGIAKEAMDRLFDVYYSTKKSGTGMGLPTSRRIIEEHDGTLGVETATGQGTNFTIRLPVEGPHVASVDAEDQADATN